MEARTLAIFTQASKLVDRAELYFRVSPVSSKLQKPPSPSWISWTYIISWSKSSSSNNKDGPHQKWFLHLVVFLSPKLENQVAPLRSFTPVAPGRPPWSGSGSAHWSHLRGESPEKRSGTPEESITWERDRGPQKGQGSHSTGCGQRNFSSFNVFLLDHLDWWTDTKGTCSKPNLGWRNRCFCLQAEQGISLIN